ERAGADGERSGAERLRQAGRPAGRRRRAQRQGPLGPEEGRLMFGIGAAGAAGPAHGAEHGGIFSDPTFWVAIAFLIFVGFAGRKIWGGIISGLDKRSESIAKSVADAERLRADALKAKADAERTLAQATAEAEAILVQ